MKSVPCLGQLDKPAPTATAEHFPQTSSSGLNSLASSFYLSQSFIPPKYGVLHLKHS